MSVPTQKAHLDMIRILSERSRRESVGPLTATEGELHTLGTAMSALYQASTCHRGCKGPSHVLEFLAGRAYNQASAAFLLAERGFYDEALSLVRNIAEMYNLVALSVVDRDAFEAWLASDRRARLRDFSPMKVRTRLQTNGDRLLHYDQDWYSEFCEKFTHATPGTQPNVHDSTQRAHVGGIVQVEGLNRVIGELATVVVALALHICQYFGFHDLFEMMVHGIREGGE